MEVILSQDVEQLGKAGAVLKVKDGFARNYLFPRRLAVPSTPDNCARIEARKQQAQQTLDKRKNDAQELAAKLAALSLTLPVLTQDEEKKLYGSISPADIVAALANEGFEIEKSAVQLEEPIKALGIYEVPVRLHPEVTATVKVWIVKK